MNKNLIYNSNMDIIVDGRVIKTIKNYSGQHYYPHSLEDYAISIRNFIQGKISSLPIMAVDCHDCYNCDFRCKDCLAEETKGWFKKNLGTFVDIKSDFSTGEICPYLWTDGSGAKNYTASAGTGIIKAWIGRASVTWGGGEGSKRGWNRGVGWRNRRDHYL